MSVSPHRWTAIYVDAKGEMAQHLLQHPSPTMERPVRHMIPYHSGSAGYSVIDYHVEQYRLMGINEANRIAYYVYERTTTR